jgi:gluconate 2-dehydrogenase gamma chain
MRIDRRLFLIAAAAAPLYPAAPLRTFSSDEAKTVEALCECIVPADEFPGAKQAGVLYYIDQQLAGPLQRFRPAYRRGLAKLADFASLSAERQAAAMQAMDQGFLQLVVDHTMQGFYGAPEHGGNRDEASWKMLGIVETMGGHSH